MKEEAEVIKWVYMNRWQSRGPNGMIKSQTLLSASGSCDGHDRPHAERTLSIKEEYSISLFCWSEYEGLLKGSLSDQEEISKKYFGQLLRSWLNWRATRKLSSKQFLLKIWSYRNLNCLIFVVIKRGRNPIGILFKIRLHVYHMFEDLFDICNVTTV